MKDPFAHLRTLETADLHTADELAAVLKEPFDDAPDFDPATDTEVDVDARLSGDRSTLHRPRRRLFVDYRANPDALKHLERFPADGESLHGVICGKYALWELVPAMIERVGRKITDLHIATLSYGRQNSEDLLGLIDDGQVKRCSLLVSYYFKAQNLELYDTLVPELRKRGHRVLAMRTHCKLLLVKFAGGGSYVCEASANLRSCKNIEQFVLTRCRRLYNFHREWMELELLAGREAGVRNVA